MFKRKRGDGMLGMDMDQAQGCSLVLQRPDGDGQGPDGHGAPQTPGELVAGLGHELKTPLSILLALCNRLEEGGRLEDQDAEDLARIRANAFTMLRRVQDLLLVARMEATDVSFDVTMFDIADTLRRCVDGFDGLFDERGVRIVVEAPTALAATLDDEKLVSVISNLVANAIRHTPRGGVVRCSLHAEAGEIVLQVADSGPGVPLERRSEVFERYRRGDSSGGSGLGLAIVGEIAALHGGTVTVGDAPEGGALFTFSVPQRLSDARTLRTVPSLTVADRQRAMVADLRGALAII
jgi:signal transduction histidine kinase